MSVSSLFHSLHITPCSNVVFLAAISRYTVMVTNTRRLSFVSRDYQSEISLGDESMSIGSLSTSMDALNGTPTLARRETVAVRILRIMVVLALLVPGALVSTAVYRHWDDEACSSDHDSSWDTQADRMFALVRDRLQRQLTTLDAFAVHMASHAHSFQMDWPRVTIPDFEWKAQTSLLHLVDSVSFLPLVENRGTWEAYSSLELAEKSIQESLDYLAAMSPSSNSETSAVLGTLRPGGIWSHEAAPTSSQNYLPLWQTSAVIPDASIYNFDMLSQPELAAALNAVLETGNAVLGGTFTPRPLDDTTSGDDEPVSNDDGLDDVLQSILRRSDAVNELSGEPAVVLLYPIFDSYSQTTSQLVGVLLATVNWSEYLTNAISVNVQEELVCVVENTVGQAFTYAVSAAGVTYLGEGDRREDAPKEGDRREDAPKEGEADEILEETRNFFDLLREPATVHNSKHRTFEKESAQYTIKVSPKQGSSSGDGSCDSEYDALTAAVLCASLFFCTFLLFVAYDCLVERRQNIVMKKATQTSAIVSSLFPENVAERLLEDTGTPAEVMDKEEDEPKPPPTDKGVEATFRPGLISLRSILAKQNDFDTIDEESAPIKPIADFFPHCTVLFGDIQGFTAWSSQREPTQVFTLLQNVYQAFDREAKKKGVFKVETIGDCYLAVTGLPSPQAQHAVIMTSFAIECRKQMKRVLRKLERTLGPDTANLAMRFGLHSGPVTAGVLRGERSRFQLFGDTVNTAARMESTGERNMIQLSEATANLLTQAGKGNWISARKGSVNVKGKGEMNTFWVVKGGQSVPLGHSTKHSCRGSSTGSVYNSMKSIVSSQTADSFDTDESMFESTSEIASRLSTNMLKKDTGCRNVGWSSSGWGSSQFDVSMELEVSRRAYMIKKRPATSSAKMRLIHWNADVLLVLLKQVVARRKLSDTKTSATRSLEKQLLDKATSQSSVVRDEVVEIITMPSFDPKLTHEKAVDLASVDLGNEVESQLMGFVTAIANMYRDNPFHNYDHACHVQASMVKLLQRVVEHSDIDLHKARATNSSTEAHDYTYGIASDPLTQFAVVFCALIHDVDHAGVSNGQLVKEKAHIASAYKNKSVAEQNSIDLAWDLLMDPQYEALRNCIYTNSAEFMRFRQLIVNVVIATDIFDKELSQVRKSRWSKAFDGDCSLQEVPSICANRKATIVIEYLIQASDVSHTMQHFEVYQKWNKRLFSEMYVAFKSGRTDTDPSEGWYKGELWFFDNYVIPLAKNLESCGVFGVSSDECLTYAMENRKLWQAQGEKIVAEIKAEHEEKMNKRRSSGATMKSTRRSR